MITGVKRFIGYTIVADTSSRFPRWEHSNMAICEADNYEDLIEQYIKKADFNPRFIRKLEDGYYYYMDTYEIRFAQLLLGYTDKKVISLVNPTTDYQNPFEDSAEESKLYADLNLGGFTRKAIESKGLKGWGPDEVKRYYFPEDIRNIEECDYKKTEPFEFLFIVPGAPTFMVVTRDNPGALTDTGISIESASDIKEE